MDEKPSLILVVDDSRTSRTQLVQELRAAGYRTATASDGLEALARIRTQPPDLVLLDVVMPGLSGYEVCRRIKADPDTILIPVVIVTSRASSERVQAMEAGADEFLTRPHNPVELQTRVRSLLRLKHHTDELENIETVLCTLAASVEARDPFTGGHCDRLAQHAVAVGRRLGLAADQLTALRRAGALHDLGKIVVPDSILLKAGPLDHEERVVVERHPQAGEAICAPLRSLGLVRPIIRHHHERWDGGGYPDGLAGHQIPLTARIIQLADIFDALTSARPYKTALSTDEAIAIMRAEAGRGWRDSSLLQLFIDTVVSQPEAKTSPGDA